MNGNRDQPGQDVDDPLLLQAVAADQVPVLMAAFRQACTQAGELGTVLAQAGLAGELVALVASLNAAGQPRVCVHLSSDGGQRLIALLQRVKPAAIVAGSRPPPGDPDPSQPRPQAA